MRTDEFEPAPPPRELPPRRRPRTWSGPWPWAMVAVVLVVGAVLTAPRPGPVVDPWGRVPDLASTPELMWEIEQSDIDDLWLFDGVIAFVARGDVVGLDIGTGERRWEVSATIPRCTSTGTSLVCATDGTTVLEIDPRSGRVDEHRIDGVVAATRHEGDLIAVTETAMIRLDDEGEVRWRVPEGGMEPSLWFAGPAVVGGQVVAIRSDLYERPDAPAAVDPETGDTLGGPGGYPLPLRDGVWTFGRGSPSTHYLLRGEPAPLVSALPVVATDAPQQLSASEFTTGTDLPFALVDDVRVDTLTGGGEGGTAATDVSTGETLWQTDQLGGLGQNTLIDNRTVAYLSSTEDEYVYTARDVRTGREHWSIAGQLTVDTDGEHLLGRTSTSVTAWELG
ncbi:PQQ-like beta-propeller repeat protein [Ruania suaedae]|uniref:outer membrane protein assembly factor BamB family protein n=1 Tax=Ruania suaedae TaxID=2897774 RepID=UPI001E28709C|nr:PQQ-binding-like beta-propeller repeat protein [Ruania suaedae]UFU02541.1 PQQ-like beta-propeller repeat protein [Ruania suaedae]